MLDSDGITATDRNRDGGWAESLVKSLGIESILDKWPPRIVAPGEVVGTLTSRAAKGLGLNNTVKVVQGGADAPSQNQDSWHSSPAHRTCSLV